MLTRRAPPPTRSTPARGSNPAKPRTRKSPGPSSDAGLKSSGASATVRFWLARCLQRSVFRLTDQGTSGPCVVLGKE